MKIRTLKREVFEEYKAEFDMTHGSYQTQLYIPTFSSLQSQHHMAELPLPRSLHLSRFS
jgi:hypothetical protein